jgi:hypothetical protein
MMKEGTMRKVWRGVALAAALTFVSGATYAADNLIPGKLGLIKATKLAKLVAKPAVDFPLPPGPDAPTAVGATIRFFDTGGAAGDNTYSLPSGTWSGLGNPAGSKGYKYKGAGSVADPCKVVLIKTAVIKAVCKGTGVTVGASSFSGNAGIIMTMGGTRYCASFGGTTIKNDPGNFKRKDAPAPGACPTVAPPTTTTTTVASCCPAQRISLTSSAGTLQVDNLPPFPFPTGVSTVMDVAGGATAPNCEHNVVIPNNGFSVPNFDIPALNYCSSVTTLGCDTGAGEGAGKLWDGMGAAGVSLTNVTKSADSSDGVCNPPGQPCSTAVGGAAANTLGNIDSVKTATAAATGVRSALDIKVHSLTWSDSACAPFFTPGCCPGSNYNPVDGDLLITQFDFVLSPTTGVGTAAFVDQNADACAFAGSGFDSPGPAGPKSLTGTPAAGPCCVVGQPTTVVSVGVGFSGGAPLYDLGFKSTIPNTVASCGAIGADTCVPTTDPCLN